jgi:predicted peptidase
MKKIVLFIGSLFLSFVGFSVLYAVEPAFTVGAFEELRQADDIDIGRKYFSSLGYRYTGGHYQNELIPFRLYIPQPYYGSAKSKHLEMQARGEMYPLVVFFHGRGNYGNNYHQLRCLRGVHFDGRFFLLAASCNKRHDCWGTIETDIDKRVECPALVCLEIIQQLLEDFPINKKEIHLIGYSDGTNAVSHIVQEGLKPKSAVYIGNEPPKDNTVYFDGNGKYNRPETELYFFYGKKDPTFPIHAVKPFVDKVKQSGGKITVKELDSPYEGHDSYKYILGEYQLIQQLTKGD